MERTLPIDQLICLRFPSSTYTKISRAPLTTVTTLGPVQHEEAASFGVSLSSAALRPRGRGEFRAGGVSPPRDDFAVNQDKRQAIVAVLAQGGNHRRTCGESLGLLGEVEVRPRPPDA